MSQSHHASSDLFREGPATHYPPQNAAANSPYINSAAASGGGNDSRISLLSMAVPPHLEDPEGGPPQFPRLHTSGSARLSLGPPAKNAKTARAMTQQHTTPLVGPGGGRPRSRTQSSEVSFFPIVLLLLSPICGTVFISLFLNQNTVFSFVYIFSKEATR